MAADPVGVVHVAAARLKVGLIATQCTMNRIVAIRLTAARNDAGASLSFVIGQDARPCVLVIVCGAKPFGPIGAVARDPHNPSPGRLGAPVSEREAARDLDEIGLPPNGEAQPC